jgi:rhamnose utilization protein RhaD (predicted bifunctional aldolase and dehydrogenase)
MIEPKCGGDAQMSPAQNVQGTERFKEFLELSRRVGNDILKTQGAGGNTSLKTDGVMWVKASGTWLAHAAERDIMVPVTIPPLVAALRDGDPRAEKSTDFVVEDLNTSGLRPSIETSFHAALLNPVVAHYHCVNAIALAVVERRDEVLAQRMESLADLKWATIPYRRPGTPLAREVEKTSRDQPDVLFLFNHGIIVTGETVQEVSERIARLSSVLATDPRQLPEPDMQALSEIAAGSGYHPASDPGSHKTALCPISMEFALGGSLYPDHVIFLGVNLGVVAAGQSALDLVQDYKNRGEEAPKMLLVPGKGVLLSDDLTQGGEVMARCLSEVVTRIPAGEKIAYLSEAEEYELTHWEAEQYRQALDKNAAGLNG